MCVGGGGALCTHLGAEGAPAWKNLGSSVQTLPSRHGRRRQSPENLFAEMYMFRLPLWDILTSLNFPFKKEKERKSE